jgi:hypothetical protein
MIKNALKIPKWLVPFIWAAFASMLLDGALNWRANGFFGMTDTWIVVPLVAAYVFLSMLMSVLAILALIGLIRGD